MNIDIKGLRVVKRAQVTIDPLDEATPLRDVGHVVKTAAASVLVTGIGSVAGIVIARALGPGGRGEYAAVTAWFAILCLLAEFGQPAAICYYIASEPDRAGPFVATSLRLLRVSGCVVAVIGLGLVPVITHGRSTTTGYVLLFVVIPAVALGYGWLFSLQAVRMTWWNAARTTQPTAFLLAVLGLWLTDHFNLTDVFIALAVSGVLQVLVARNLSQRLIHSHGEYDRSLIRPLSSYGASNLAATAPSIVNVRLDQVVLSLAVASSALGEYAVGVSLTMLVYPLATAFGYVAMPRLARTTAGHAADIRRTLLSSLGVATLLMVPIAAFASWYLPVIFGDAFRPAVTVVWLLAPGGIFLAQSQVMGDVLRGLNRPIDVAKSQAVGAVLTVALLSITIPIWGIRGAAVTSSIAYATTCGCELYAIMRAERRDIGHAQAQTVSA